MMTSMRTLCGLILFGAVCSGAPPVIGGCAVFPANNVWNTPVDTLDVAPASDKHISSINPAKRLHPDFGADLNTGIPYTVIDNKVAKVKVAFQYADESDPGPYPIPAKPVIEGGPGATSGDRHLLLVDRSDCVLYELFEVIPDAGGWKAGSGAIFNLRANDLRKRGWTSADAAGLPILPGLIRYDEVKAGEIAHALRFTLSTMRSQFIWPARHNIKGPASADFLQMGARLRLKKNVDIAGFSDTNQVILKALKKYGMFLADTGSDMFITGTSDKRWDDSDLHQLTDLSATDFEEVDTTPLKISDITAESHPAPPKK
jgi:hypothetical protein